MLKSLFSRGIWSAYECPKCKSKIFHQVATVPTVLRTYFFNFLTAVDKMLVTRLTMTVDSWLTSALNSVAST